MKREVTTFKGTDGRTVYRAHIWTDGGYSTSVFFTRRGAESWTGPTQTKEPDNGLD